MRIYISVDMEGISGVTRWQDVITSGQDYQRARSWMTADVNAAVAGARAAGAEEFVVEENHGVEMLCNLVLDEIDPEVEVVRGAPRSRQITTAIALDDSFDAMFLIGHHAKAGSHDGIGAHTISYENYKRVSLNGRPVSEGEIFATMAAQQGVPTALIAGDDVICDELACVCPGIETAVVKTALGKTAGRIIPPVRAAGIIRDAAESATRRVRANNIAALDVAPPFQMEVELRDPLKDDTVDYVRQHRPELTLVNDRTIAFDSDDMAVAYRLAAAVQFLAASGKLDWY